ncbi:MAG TPA: QueT transporter family protein [Enterococcus cecorum]|nr:QueT transporter family protein [Enterococcus cecorum]
MHQEKPQTIANSKTLELAKSAIVAALYVALTVVLAPFSYGAIQVRIAEMFNFLPLYNKRYIWAVTVGVFISNLFSQVGPIDLVVGTLSTLFVLLINVKVTENMKSMKQKMAVSTIICAVSMFTIAAELTLVAGLPFFYSWLTIGVGEFIAMAVGSLIIYAVGKKIDLTK